MALAPRPLATTVLICRMVAVILQATALMYVELAGNLWFSVFMYVYMCYYTTSLTSSSYLFNQHHFTYACRFLKAVLATELPLNAARLIYDAAQVFFQKPLPALRWEMMGLVAADWVRTYSSISFRACATISVYLRVHACIAGDDAPPFRCWIELPSCGGFRREEHEALRVATARDVRTVQGRRRAYLTGVGFHCPGRLRYAPSTKDLGSRRRRRSRCMMGGQLVPKDGR